MSNRVRTTILSVVFLLTTGWVNLISAEENLGSQVDGEKAFLLGDYVEAEKIR